MFGSSFKRTLGS